MKNLTKSNLKLELYSYYNKSEVLKLDVKSLNNRGMKYLFYLKNDIIYYFEKVRDDTYHLFFIN